MGPGLSLITVLASMLAHGPNAAGASPHAAVPPHPAPVAILTVSERSPRQRYGIVLNASRSSGTGGIVGYGFDYGDGITEASYQPLASHGYRRTGNYLARVAVLDSLGSVAVSAPVPIRVRDGIPPVVRIDTPRQDQRVHFGHSGLMLRGRASDPSGLRSVQLAVQLVALPPGRVRAAAAGCVWYDGKRHLVLRRCDAPPFFNVRVRGLSWSFRVDPGALLPVGTYGVRVRGTDRAGNVSNFYAVRLKTILAFRLVP